MGHNSYSRERAYIKVRSLRAIWISKNGPCRSCGSTVDLEVDHIDPKQKITHNVWSWSESRRLNELAKCQVLCSSCHKIKSREYRLIGVPEHGIHGYNKRGCRCSICRSSIAEHHRNKRISKWGTASSRPPRGILIEATRPIGLGF